LQHLGPEKGLRRAPGPYFLFGSFPDEMSRVSQVEILFNTIETPFNAVDTSALTCDLCLQMANLGP